MKVNWAFFLSSIFFMPSKLEIFTFSIMMTLSNLKVFHFHHFVLNFHLLIWLNISSISFFLLHQIIFEKISMLNLREGEEIFFQFSLSISCGIQTFSQFSLFCVSSKLLNHHDLNYTHIKYRNFVKSSPILNSSAIFISSKIFLISFSDFFFWFLQIDIFSLCQQQRNFHQFFLVRTLVMFLSSSSRRQCERHGDWWWDTFTYRQYHHRWYKLIIIIRTCFSIDHRFWCEHRRLFEKERLHHELSSFMLGKTDRWSLSELR